MKTYFIKEGYRTNLETPERLRKYESVPPDEYQEDVYGYAASLVKRYGLRSVVDCGCGSGHKLANFIGPVCSDITGLDQEVSIKSCSNKYPQHTWHVKDFEDSRVDIGRKYDLVLSIDVIEHLDNPDSLLAILKSLANPKGHIVISTPERDLVHGVGNPGPPTNPYHIREWNMREFRTYLQSSGFEVLDHILVNATAQFSWKRKFLRLISPKRFKTCQVIHCRVSE